MRDHLAHADPIVVRFERWARAAREDRARRARAAPAVVAGGQRAARDRDRGRGVAIAARIDEQAGGERRAAPARRWRGGGARSCRGRRDRRARAARPRRCRSARGSPRRWRSSSTPGARFTPPVQIAVTIWAVPAGQSLAIAPGGVAIARASVGPAASAITRRAQAVAIGAGQRERAGDLDLHWRVGGLAAELTEEEHGVALGVAVGGPGGRAAGMKPRAGPRRHGERAGIEVSDHAAGERDRHAIGARRVATQPARGLRNRVIEAEERARDPRRLGVEGRHRRRRVGAGGRQRQRQGHARPHHCDCR